MSVDYNTLKSIIEGLLFLSGMKACRSGRLPRLPSSGPIWRQERWMI